MVRIVRASQTDIEAAVELLRAGELVAFPTETVYGLGANASNPAAVRKTLEQLKAQNLPRRALPRSRHNVRVPGRVYARRGKPGGRTRV